MGKKNDFGPFLVGDFVFDYFVGAVFEGLVVGISAMDADGPVENNLLVVD